MALRMFELEIEYASEEREGDDLLLFEGRMIRRVFADTKKEAREFCVAGCEEDRLPEDRTDYRELWKSASIREIPIKRGIIDV